MTAATAVQESALMIALRACERGDWAHSPLYVWMTEHFDALTAAVGGRRVRWAKIAAAAAADGLTTRHGTTAAANTVKSTYYRVRRALLAMRERADAAATEREAKRAADEEARRREAAEAEDLRARTEKADLVAAQKRQDEAARERLHANRKLIAPKAPEAQVDSAQDEAIPDGFVMLDLPRLSTVSDQAYLPVDLSLPPVRQGERSPITGIPWEVGDDLPGYPSKRNYEYEREWLRDVALLLRHRHPTNLTMTLKEQRVMRTAQSVIRNLY